MTGPQDEDRLPDEIALMDGKADGISPEDFEDKPAEAAAPAAEAPAQAEAAAAPTEPAAEEAPEPAAFVPEFKGELPADFAEAKKAITTEKGALLKQWSEGELSDEDYAAKVAELDDRRDALVSQQTRVETLAEANRQMQAQQAQQTLHGIKTEAAKVGVDYADEGMAAMFDAKLNGVLRDEAFKGKSFAESAAEAHARVLKAIGKTAAPAAAPAAPAAPPKAEKPPIPPTLGMMPNAAPQANAQDLGDELASITDPDEAEARWAAMPARVREQQLRGSVVR